MANEVINGPNPVLKTVYDPLSLSENRLNLYVHHPECKGLNLNSLNLYKIRDYFRNSFVIWPAILWLV